MNYKEIIVEKKGKITWLTLNRPTKMNALTPLMLQEWRHAMESIEKDDDCSVLIVKGEGKAWSSGVDLTAFQETKVEPGFRMFDDGLAIINMLSGIPKPTIAMLNGHCFTGALEIMLAFDMVFAADSAKIGDTHSKWGIPPKWGMTVRLMHQVGLKKAKELSFTAEPVDGKEAERIGLVNQSVPLEKLEALVIKKAELIAGNSYQTIAAEKELYEFTKTNHLNDSIVNEQEYELKITDKTDTLKNFKNKLHE
jgi:enoyl-CoA hydratase